MATCCLPFSLRDGEATGTFKEVHGLDTYVAGDSTSKKVIVFLTDIYGYKFKNNQLLADAFAKSGYYVLVPDILEGGVGLDWPSEQKMAVISKIGPEVTRPKVRSYFTKVREELKPAFIGTIGYCFGARYTNYELFADGLADAGVICHPSRTVVEDYENITKPLLISAAETDQSFGHELRHAAEAAVLKNQVPFQSTLFSGVSHGFAVKGDFSIEAVKYAAEKAFKDHVDWFNRFSA